LIQGSDIRAGANVIFRHDHDVSVPGPALLPFKHPQPVQKEFGKDIRRDGFEAAFKFLAVGDILPNRHGLQTDVINPVVFNHPLDPQPQGKHFLAEARGNALNDSFNRLLFLFGLEFIPQDRQIELNAIVSILMNKGSVWRGSAALRRLPLLPSPQIYRQGIHGSTSGEESTVPTMARMAALSSGESFDQAVTTRDSS